MVVVTVFSAPPVKLERTPPTAFEMVRPFWTIKRSVQQLGW